MLNYIQIAFKNYDALLDLDLSKAFERLDYVNLFIRIYLHVLNSFLLTIHTLICVQ